LLVELNLNLLVQWASMFNWV